MSNAQSINHTTAQRIQTLTLAEHDVAVKIVADICEMSHQSVYVLKKKTRQRNYNSEISRLLKKKYVTDTPRSERSLKVTSEIEKNILENVRKDRNSREKSFAVLEFEHDISSIIILEVLKRNEMKSCKDIKKFELNSIMKKARLQFCLRHQH